MSEVAGRLSIQAGAHYLEKAHGGHGLLLGGSAWCGPGQGGDHRWRPWLVAMPYILRLAWAPTSGCIDRNVDVLRSLWAQFDRPLNTVYSTRDAIERHCIEADLVVSGVLIPGAAAPKLITRDIVKKMKAGSVIVDVAIDQGGSAETSRATTHDDPVYVVDDVIHYCVANMPGGVPKTSTYALNNATLPFILQIANRGWRKALSENKHLMAGFERARRPCDLQGCGR